MAYGDNIVSISDITSNATVWAPGEEVSISFKLKNASTRKFNEMALAVALKKSSFTGTATGNNDIFLHWILGTASTRPTNVSIAAGKSKTFSATFVVTEQIASYFSENKNIRTVPICIFYAVDTSVPDVLNSRSVEIPDLRIMNHRFNPRVESFKLVRAVKKVVDGVNVFSINDEGENVLTTLKLNINSGNYDYKKFFTAKLYWKKGGKAGSASTADPFVDITDKIASLLSGIASDHDLLAKVVSESGQQPGIFDKAYDWDFLLVFGDAYETALENTRTDLGMAFANLHLSGVSTGGACFGGFCTSKFEHPKLESYYPIRPYGGIEAVKDGVYVQELDLDSDAPFKVREDNPLQPTVRVFGHIVELHGELQPTKKITGSDAYYPICTLPAQYAPEHDVVTLQQGSTQAIWMLRIFNRNHPEHPCKVMFSRYRDGANWADATTSSPLTWLPFHAVWCIDGSVTGDSEALAALLMDSQGYSLLDAGGNDIAIMSATDEPYQLPYTGEQLEAKLGLIDTALQKSGGTISGHLTLTETPTEDGHATPKRYVDQQIAEIELTPGASAYDIAKKNGFVGSEAEWLESLHGEDGYTPVKDKDYRDGIDGKSAYEYAQEGGYEGTEEEFAEDLGKVGTGGTADSVAWANITDKPFGNPITGSVVIDGDTLRWDGDTTGMVTTKIRYDDVVFVSDNVPSIEKLKIGCDITCHTITGDRYLTTFTEQYTTYPDVIMLCYTHDGDVYYTYAYVVLKPNASFYGGKIERAGLYFIDNPVGTDSYIKEFTLLNYPWTVAKEIAPIPDTFIPVSIARAEELANVSDIANAVDDRFEHAVMQITAADEIVVGNPIVHDHISQRDYIYVSDYVPERVLFKNGYRVQTVNPNQTIVYSGDYDILYDSDNFYHFNDQAWVIMQDDLWVTIPGSSGGRFPKRGTYFALDDDEKLKVVGLGSDSMSALGSRTILSKEHIPILSELIMVSSDGSKLFKLTIDSNGNLVPSAI